MEARSGQGWEGPPGGSGLGGVVKQQDPKRASVPPSPVKFQKLECSGRV